MKKYLHSNIPQLISKRLINMEIDSPMIKEIFCDLSCLINRLSIVPEKKNCKKKQKNKKNPKKLSMENISYENLRDNHSV